MDHAIEQMARDHEHRAPDVARLLHVIGVRLIVRAAAMRAHLQHLAEASALEDLLHRVDRGREAPTVADLQEAAGALHRFDDAPGVGRVPASRLLAEHGLPGLERLDGQIGHLIALRVHVHDVNFRIVEDLALGSRLQPQGFCKRHKQRTVVRRTHHPRIGQPPDGAHAPAGVGMCDP